MKKIFLSFLLGFVGFIGFGYCADDVATLLDTYTVTNVTIPQNGWVTLMDLQSLGLQYKTVCIKFIQSTPKDLDWGPTSTYHAQPGTVYRTWWDWIRDGKYTCTYVAGDLYLNANSPAGSNTFDIEYFILEDLMATPLPLMSSAECQSEYNLIPISDVDTNYCVENDFCPSSPGSASWSELVINNIVHEGRPLINLNIPDYITRDYTVDENQYDIYVGSGYDQDYIDSILAINSYRPDNEDFTNIFVSGLTLIFPYIFVALLILFIWKLLKRIFK